MSYGLRVKKPEQLLPLYVINYLNIALTISIPLAYKTSPISRNIPAICAYSRNLSLGFLPEIASTSRKRTCPPSNPGMGRMFINAKITERKAVIIQNEYQFHFAGKRFPIVPKPPSDDAPSLVNICLNWETYPFNVRMPYFTPAGNDSDPLPDKMQY